MILKKAGILILGLYLISCNDSSHADYFTYLEEVQGIEKIKEVDNSKLSFNFQIVDNFKIADTSNTENILFQINFRGKPEAFPEDLNLEFYVNDQKLSLSGTINYTATTVINGSVRNFSIQEKTLRIKDVLDEVRKKNNIADTIPYMSVAGIFPKVSLGNNGNPPKLKVILKAVSQGKLIYEKARNYELKRPYLHNLRSRPFG